MTAFSKGDGASGSLCYPGRWFFAYRKERALQNSFESGAAERHCAVRIVAGFAFLQEQNLSRPDTFIISPQDYCLRR